MTRRALITGAASGIGLAAAHRLDADGLDVFVCDLNRRLLADVGKPFAGAHILDVTDTAAVRALVADLDPIDVLVNSAGILGPSAPVWEVGDEDWQRTLSINLTGTFNTIRAVIPGMRDRGWGRIVNVASIAGKEGNPNLSAYSASKAAVIGLTKSVGKETATDGVLVNAIAPAVIETPMVSDADPEVVEYMKSKIPMGRFGLSEEVAALISWLASDECSFSTGHTFDISGGRATY